MKRIIVIAGLMMSCAASGRPNQPTNLPYPPIVRDIIGNALVAGRISFVETECIIRKMESVWSSKEALSVLGRSINHRMSPVLRGMALVCHDEFQEGTKNDRLQDIMDGPTTPEM